MLSRASLVAELRTYLARMKPPLEPGARDWRGVGNRNTADRELIERWLADDRADDGWRMVCEAAAAKNMRIEPELVIKTVLAARRSARATVNRIYGVRHPHRLSGWSDRLQELKERITDKLVQGPGKLEPDDVAHFLEEQASALREWGEVNLSFSDHRGLPGRTKFEVSRQDQDGSRARKLFMRIASDFFFSHLNRPLDEVVATLTEVAFPGKQIDVEDVIAARKPTTKSGRTRKSH
jgi:hypothetical protein